MNCTLREPYLDGQLSPERAAHFEEHLSACTSCSVEIAQWEDAAVLLAEWSDARTAPPIPSATSQHQSEIIVALHRANRGQLRRTVVSLGLAAAASFFLALLLFGGTEPQRASLLTEVIYQEGASSELSEDVLTVLGKGRLIAQIGSDRIGLGDDASVRVLGASEGTLELRLERGNMAMDAAGRGESDELVIQAGIYRVRVLGTRFSVRHPRSGGLRVRVDEGRVEVTSPGQRWIIDAGKSLELGAEGRPTLVQRDGEDLEINRLLSPMRQDAHQPNERALETPATKAAGTTGAAAEVAGLDEFRGALKDTRASPAEVNSQPAAPSPRAHPEEPAADDTGGPDLDFAGLRVRLARGEAAEVANILTDHLKEAPNSVIAWGLLATAHRKSGDYGAAIEAHRRVIAQGTKPEAERARYEAARMLQEMPGGQPEAVAFFEDLLSAPGALPGLQPEIRLHLSRSLRAIGRIAEADGLLQEIITRWPATAAAEIAVGERSTTTH
jgi:ferric-dicitrate binding protein FerR (iron transport regulator)/TolA-binding protein